MRFRYVALIAVLLSLPFDFHVIYHSIDYLTAWHGRDFFGPLSPIFDPQAFYTPSGIFLTFGTIHGLLDGFAFAPAIWLGVVLWLHYKRCHRSFK